MQHYRSAVGLSKKNFEVMGTPHLREEQSRKRAGGPSYRCIMVPMRFLLAVLFCLPLCAQPPQPKNLKILKPEGLITTMRSFGAALGQECQYCHVRGDFASDDNPKKNIARMMIAMAGEVNAKFPDGKPHVTCYTCHRGEPTPKMAPVPAAAPEKKP
jgi:Photosynthetic reaction centre cytochrome C subunit